MLKPELEIIYISQTAFSNVLGCRKYFHIHLFFTEVHLHKSYWCKVDIGSGNSLVSDWHQAITWTNDDSVLWHICITWMQWVNDSNPVL